MPPSGRTLGVDFGTSNSAAGFVRDRGPQLIPLDGGRMTLPTTFFFDFESRKTLIGEPANQALLDGVEGRFMRALKRVLGTTLMHEKRQLLNERLTFADIITRFLVEVKSRAEAETGTRFAHVLSGRPVVFHGKGDAREAAALADLKACYHTAGFDTVTFMAEPEAAARATGGDRHRGETGLIVDIGGGTSDFSAFTVEQTGISIRANHGVRIGGTDFDRSISIAHVMPELGKGSALRKVLGTGTVQTPSAIYNDLATWEKIPLLYTPQNRRMIAEMQQLAEEPQKLARLATVFEDSLGHDLAFAVEAGKIAANDGQSDAAIDLGEIERGFRIPLPPASLTASLAHHAQTLREGARETLRLADLDKSALTRIIYVGGSSLLSLVGDAMRSEFPDAEHTFSEVFTAVTHGLAIAAHEIDQARPGTV